jgi:hypothetical protein
LNPEERDEMADMQKLSERMVDLAERFADVTDAAQGKDKKRKMRARWLVLPAAGAGLFALGTSGSFTRRAKDVVSQAKDRASDLPEDLLGRVQQAAGTTNSGAGNGRSTSRTTTKNRRRRKTTSAR